MRASRASLFSSLLAVATAYVSQGAATLLLDYRDSLESSRAHMSFLEWLKKQSDWRSNPEVPHLLAEIIQHSCVTRIDGSELKLLRFAKLHDLQMGDLAGMMRDALLCGCRSQHAEVLIAIAWRDTAVLADLLREEADWADHDDGMKVLSNRSIPRVSDGA